MPDAHIPDLSIHSLRALYRSGQLEPDEVIGSIYDKIEAASLRPVWITLVPRSQALARADALRSNESSRHFPLFGIPFAIKDNMDLAGFDTTAGCPSFAYQPEKTAFVVQRLIDAGAILVGNTNLDQFATGLVGTRSPYGANSSVFNQEYISGGSSSGSAVAVAAGLVSFALGTDTAGSGRVPAAFNNIVGLKPSRGLLSTSGVVPACRSLDCVSIFALSCADAADVFETAKAFDPIDPYSRESPTLCALTPEVVRIAIPRRNQWEFFGDKEAASVYSQTIESIASQGHSIIEIDLQPFRQAAELLYSGPYVAERFAAVGAFVTSHAAEVDPVVGSIISASERFSAVEAYEAEYQRRILARQTSRVWQDADALLLPTAPTIYTLEEIRREPVKLNSNLGYYTNFVNLLDLAAIAVPAGFTSTEVAQNRHVERAPFSESNARDFPSFGRDRQLPFGVTVIGPAFSEYMLLRLADQIHNTRLTFAGNHAAPMVRFQAPEAAVRKVSLGVVGAHLSGQPLNHQLTSRGGTLVRTTKTAAFYKLYALTGTIPAKPGLVRVSDFDGPGIEIEVWSIPETEFGSFVAAVPQPLSIGTCELADGELVKGFLCEPYATHGMFEITHYESWRKYLSE